MQKFRNEHRSDSETYAIAWTCLFRNIEITKGQSKGGTLDIDQLRPPAREAAGARNRFN